MVGGAALEAALEVIRALEDLRVDYLVGGSLASSLHGTPRSTQDADLVADLKLAQWDDLLGVLKVQEELDWDYLARWSTYLGLEELYRKALDDAGRNG